ncbi:MAG: hypothetical protein AVDCRST_MAG90-1386, partial [uncultured Microvirga sp.]
GNTRQLRDHRSLHARRHGCRVRLRVLVLGLRLEPAAPARPRGVFGLRRGPRQRVLRPIQRHSGGRGHRGPPAAGGPAPRRGRDRGRALDPAAGRHARPARGGASDRHHDDLARGRRPRSAASGRRPRPGDADDLRRPGRFPGHHGKRAQHRAARRRRAGAGGQGGGRERRLGRTHARQCRALLLGARQQCARHRPLPGPGRHRRRAHRPDGRKARIARERRAEPGPLGRRAAGRKKRREHPGFHPDARRQPGQRHEHAGRRGRADRAAERCGARGRQPGQGDRRRQGERRAGQPGGFLQDARRQPRRGRRHHPRRRRSRPVDRPGQDRRHAGQCRRREQDARRQPREYFELRGGRRGLQPAAQREHGAEARRRLDQRRRSGQGGRRLEDQRHPDECGQIRRRARQFERECRGRGPRGSIARRKTQPVGEPGRRRAEGRRELSRRRLGQPGIERLRRSARGRQGDPRAGRESGPAHRRDLERLDPLQHHRVAGIRGARHRGPQGPERHQPHGAQPGAQSEPGDFWWPSERPRVQGPL